MKTILAIGLLLTSSARAGVVDTAVFNGGLFVAIGSSGDIWDHQIDGGYETWRHLFDIPGAYLIATGGSLVLIATPTEMQIWQFFLDSNEPSYEFMWSCPIPSEVGQLKDMTFCDIRCHPLFYAVVTTTTDETWTCRLDAGFWTGPVGPLPDGPISVIDESWGKVKERFR